MISATIADTKTTTEEPAIAFGFTTASTGYVAILTDSQQSCSSFLTRGISLPALKLLQKVITLPPNPHTQIVGTPGEASLLEKEGAHAAAPQCPAPGIPIGGLAVPPF